MHAALVPDGWDPALPAPASTVFDPYAGDPQQGDGLLDGLELSDPGMYGLPGPADLARRAPGGDPLFLSPAHTGAGQWSQEAEDAFKASYFDDLPPLENGPGAAAPPLAAPRDAEEDGLFDFLDGDLGGGLK